MATTYSFYQDSTGQWWSFSINPDGSAETIQIAAPSPAPSPTVLAYDNSTITLLDTMEWANKYMGNRASAIGNYLEPALTSANIVMQTMLGAPFRWRWNRVVTGFITSMGEQDYYLFNWKADTPVDFGWVLVDTNGNSQRVLTAGTTGATMPNWSNTVGGNTTDGTGGGAAVWNNLGPIGVSVTNTYSFGWIETVSLQDTLNQWWEIQQKICLASDSSQARPGFISAQGDDGTGNISFRLMPVPNNSYPVAITVQQIPPLFTYTGQTWAPIPDFYSNIYNWGFLSLMLLFNDDPRFQIANQKFVTSLLARNQGLTQTEINVFLNNWQEVTGQPVELANTNQQGVQSRSV